jgi:hypothetical protein
MAADSPYGGATARQLAEGLQKRADVAHAEAIKALGSGDYRTATVLNQQHGLGLDSVLANPSASKVASRLASSMPAKLDAQQVVAFQSEAARAFQQKYQQTGDYDQAYDAAGNAGMTAAIKVAPKGDKILVTNKGEYVHAQSGEMIVNPTTGKPYIATKRLTEPTYGRGAGGAGGGEPAAVQIDKARIDGLVEAGIPRNQAILMVHGKNQRTPAERLNAERLNAAQKIVKDSFGQVTLDAALQSIDRAAAGHGGQPAAPTEPAAGRVRQYVPGQGFVDVP